MLPIACPFGAALLETEPPWWTPRIAAPAWGLLPFSSRFARLHGRGPAGIARANYLETFVENIKWEAPGL